jgi:hypothetical protein
MKYILSKMFYYLRILGDILMAFTTLRGSNEYYCVNVSEYSSPVI